MAPSRTGSPRTLSAARNLLATRSPLRGDEAATATDDALGRPRAAAGPLPVPALAEDGPPREGRQPAAPPPLLARGFTRPATAPGGVTASVGQGRVPASGPASAPKRTATTVARGGTARIAGRLTPAGEQPAEPAHAAAAFGAWPVAERPPFPPQRTPAPGAGADTAGERGSEPATPVEAPASEPLGAPQPMQTTPSLSSADRLFDPRGQLTDRTVAALVDTARAQTRNPRYDGTAGRRPVGSGLWLAWDDEADAPMALPSGGVLLLAAEDGDARVGVARDSATGGYLAWDLERNAPWPDANGDPIALPTDLVSAHAEAGGMSPLEVAQTLVAEHELRALAEADQASLPGNVAAMNALLAEIEQSDHPLFDLLAPYVTAVNDMLPQAAGAAQWLRVTERRTARAILDQFLRLLHTGLDDPARLGEIVDPERARSAGDPTRTVAGDSRQTGVQFADSPHIMSDAIPAFGADSGSGEHLSAEQDAGEADPILLAQSADDPSLEGPSPTYPEQLLRDHGYDSTLFANGGPDSQDMAAWVAVDGRAPRPVVVDDAESTLWSLGGGGWFVLAAGGVGPGARYQLGMAPDWLRGFAFIGAAESGRAMAYRADISGGILEHGVPLDSEDYAELAGHPLLDQNQALAAAAFGSYSRTYSALVRDGALYSERLEMAALLDDLYQGLVEQKLLFGGSGPVDDQVRRAIDDGAEPQLASGSRQEVSDALSALSDPGFMFEAAGRADAARRYAEFLETGEYPKPADPGAPPDDLTDEVIVRFDGVSLAWIEQGEVVERWSAVSGREGAQTAAFQSIHNVGPIPEGEYFVRQDQYQSFGDLSTLQVLAGLDRRGQWPGGSLAWGSHRIELFPSYGTNAYGRTDMFIHGGYEPGSAGCIDLTDQIASFIRRFHHLGRSVRLVVDYYRVGQDER